MTKPTAAVRQATYARDNNTCVAANSECGGGLEWGHRESSGHGGRGSKAPLLTVADGITNCRNHNQRFEGDLQDLALRSGWKLKRNRRMNAADIPYWASDVGAWYLPLDLKRENPLVPMLALELLDAAGSIRSGVTA
jgi:hypothetical protein